MSRKREDVEHGHFGASSVFAVLGALTSVALLVDTGLGEAAVFLRAAIVLVLGGALGRLSAGGWVAGSTWCGGAPANPAPGLGRAAVPGSARR